jgi:glycosyltransferase involved in cell wall biosynthesis
MFNNAFYHHTDEYIYPDFSEFNGMIETGQFLDINKTIIFKTMQLQMIARMFHKGEIKNGDTFIVADIFFPGLESIKYRAELQGLKVRIFAFNHAGRADEEDFVQKLGPWADVAEKAYHDICDGIMFGSEYHALKVLKYFDLRDSQELIIEGMIWDRKYVDQIYNSNNDDDKLDVIVWPHRLAPEKGINELFYYADRNPDKSIIVTSCGKINDIPKPKNVTFIDGLSKPEYYQILSQSKYYLSTALQETFGYTLQEAIHYGCEIAVPNRACYKEMVPAECLYDSIDNVVFYKVDKRWTEKHNHNVERILEIIKS